MNTYFLRHPKKWHGKGTCIRDTKMKSFQIGRERERLEIGRWIN
jgi:hypothetical protein